MKKTRIIRFRIDEVTKERFQDYANRRGMGVSEVLRECVDELLDAPDMCNLLCNEGPRT